MSYGISLSWMLILTSLKDKYVPGRSGGRGIIHQYFNLSKELSREIQKKELTF